MGLSQKAVAVGLGICAGAITAIGLARGESPSIDGEEVAIATRSGPSEVSSVSSLRRRDGTVALSAPRLDDWRPDPRLKAPPKASEAPRVGLAYHYDSRVFRRASETPDVLGFIRRGTHVPVEERVFGSGCEDGHWYRLQGEGFICTNDGFRVADEPIEFNVRQRPPAINEPLPFRYAEVTSDGALRFHRPPSPSELAAIETARETDHTLPDVVQTEMKGDYYVALDLLEPHEGTFWMRTVRGRYVRPEDIKPLDTPAMRGEVLGSGFELPLAFVFGKRAELFEFDGDTLERRGFAEKHARVAVKGVRERDGRQFVVDSNGFALPRESVRIASVRSRPEGVGAKSKWVHVDLAEQTLVAYEGDHPVFATLISSGKEGYETRSGLFRVRHKHVSITMSGADPIDGFYEVAEVPWTLFYYQGYALHGAYWHNDFGQTRSHGCTNIAPADARWLFYWTDPGIAHAWHAVRDNGTWIYFTG